MRPMTSAQRSVLLELEGHILFPGYCEIMLQTGLKSWKAVDWVLDALINRGLVSRDSEELEITDAGKRVIAQIKGYKELGLLR